MKHRHLFLPLLALRASAFADTIITNREGLAAIDFDLSGSYALGDDATPFTGSFHGTGYAISNLTVTDSSDYAGLFGCLGSGATGSQDDAGIGGGRGAEW